MPDFPTSLGDFQRRYPDEAACAAWLFTARWPAGFRCPACAHEKGWPHGGKPFTFECAACGKQTSVTAGTIMPGSKLPLTAWFWAAYLVATHSNGIPALQLRNQLGLGSYKSAWLLGAKLRRAMVAPGRSPLAGLAEVDETEIPLRTKDDPVAGGGGRSHRGKMRSRKRRARPHSSRRDHGLLRSRAARLHRRQRGSRHHDPHRRLVGLSRRAGCRPRSPCHRSDRRPCGAAVDPPRLLQPEDLGVYHGLRKKHLQAYLDEFAFRFNRRRTRHAAFPALLGIGVVIPSATYTMLIQPDVEDKA